MAFSIKFRNHLKILCLKRIPFCRVTNHRFDIRTHVLTALCGIEKKIFFFFVKRTDDLPSQLGFFQWILTHKSETLLREISNWRWCRKFVRKIIIY